jgi:hypothetical protein
MAEAKTNSTESLIANRYLLERGWMRKDKSEQVASDFDRLMKAN